LIGILLVICGVLIVFGIGRRFEESAEAAVVRSEEAHGVVHLDAPTFQRNLLAVLPPVLLTFYVVVVEFFGFLPTAFTIVVAMVFAFGGRLVLALSMGVAAPVLLHIVFYKLLRVPLPAGLLPAPW
jgi:putative tricarboxylic transport membrane protein